MMDLEQIEAALDAQFGTIERGSDSGEGSDDEGNEEDLRCIVCEKTFKNKFVLFNVMFLIKSQESSGKPSAFKETSPNG